MKVLTFLLPFILIFFPFSLRASTQSEIFSDEARLAIATYEKIYEFHDENAAFFLGKETSYLNYRKSQNGTRFKYTITSRFPHGETIDQTVLHLPEIGDWSVSRLEYAKNKYSKWDSYIKLYFHLRCNIYESNTKIEYRYPMGYGVDDIELGGGIYEMNNWYTYHFGNRPSIENLSHVRFSKDTIFKKCQENKKFEIFIARDMDEGLRGRQTNNYDDMYFFHNDDTGQIQTAFLTCFIVPRIFFVKFEESSLSMDIMDDLSPIRFTIIVQQFENPEQTVWNYHRLEIVREQSAHEIQINDLGPLPRSEWEPGWPDPATTPLWKEPEDECAQCQ